MTLKFNRLLPVVKINVRAKFHPVECSGSGVIVLTEKNKRTYRRCWKLYHGQ